MRRFLGANLHINTGASTEDNQQAGATSLSSTKRAFQNTFGQLSRGDSSNTGSSKTSPNPSYQQYDHAPPVASPSISNSPLPVNSPVPPTPPSKHGHEEDNAAEEYDDSSWDDAFKLPFGSSSTSSSAASALSRASSSASSATNPYDGVIDRTSSIAGASVHERTTTAVGDEEDSDDDDNDLTRAGHRTSTATISASRANMIASPPPLQSSTSTSMQYTNTHQSAISNNNSNSRGLAVSATYAANASSLVDLKDEMMLELLSSDALIHVAQFEILGFDEVEELRKVGSYDILRANLHLYTQS